MHTCVWGLVCSCESCDIRTSSGRYQVYKSFVGELAMHLQEVDKDSAASGEARLRVERMIEDKVQRPPTTLPLMSHQAHAHGRGFAVLQDLHAQHQAATIVLPAKQDP